MSALFKSRKKIALLLSCVFMSLTLVSATIAGVVLGGYLGPRASAAEPPGPSDVPPQEESGGVATVDTGDGNGEGDSDSGGDGVLLPGDEPESTRPDEPVYNIPAEMRGVYLVPGYDFLKDTQAAADVIQAEIDKALTDAVNFTMNTVIVDTVYNDDVIFEVAGVNTLDVGFDVMSYLAGEARRKDLHLYAIFDASKVERAGDGASALAISAGTISNITQSLREFADKYSPDAILIDGYTQPPAETDEEVAGTFQAYLLSGGAVGFGNYRRQSPEAVVQTASRTLRRYAPNIQIGLLADPVWADSDTREDGLAVTASYTALEGGNADTKGYVESGAVDFVAVKAYSSLADTNEPFETVVDWWGALARGAGLPLYVVHASDKACTQNAGWTSPDQLTKQVIASEGVSGYGGSIFNSLSRLVANPQGTTTTLVRYYEGEVSSEHILTELAVTKPELTSYTTEEPSVVFTGASDPNSPVTINDREITTDESGYFTVSMELRGGENTFIIKHKEKTVTYTITRNIEVLKEVEPTGTISTDGGMTIAITALAYEDAEVFATIAGETIPMEIEDWAEDEDSRDSNFRRFVGFFDAPAGTKEEQNLGAIAVTATWQGTTASLPGATVVVNKRAMLEDGVPVVVVADQAVTFPVTTLDNIPNANYYPLPKGAMDYAVGDEMTYRSYKGEIFQFYNLASGLRVHSKDIAPLTNDYPGGNAISGMSVTAEGRYTYLTLKTAQKVSYKIKYTGSEFTVTFHNTTSNPGGSRKLDSNPLFTGASWGSDSLTLTLAKAGGFSGFRGYYDSNGNLVFRFNTPPRGLRGARIAIDPGHGGADTGALGFLANYPERTINRAIADMLADELASRGAEVLRIENRGNPSLENRVWQAEQFNADLFVSVHNNTATRLSAQGTETYFHYPYSATAATTIAAHVAARMGTENRGPRQSYYHIILSPQMPSVLVECGFLTNQREYEKLIRADYQQAIAEGIADGIEVALQSVNTGVSGSGSQSMGSGVSAAAPDDDEETGDDDIPFSDGDGEIELLYFADENLLIEEGDIYPLALLAEPEDADLSDVTFKSGNTSVATVSASGRVTAVAAGRAKITATAANGEEAVCEIEVTRAGDEFDVQASDDDGGGMSLQEFLASRR